MDGNATDPKQDDRALELCNFPECTQRLTKYAVKCVCGVKYCSKACKRKEEKSSFDTEYETKITSHLYHCDKILSFKKILSLKKKVAIDNPIFSIISNRYKTYQEYLIINKLILSLTEKKLSTTTTRSINYSTQKPNVFGIYIDPKLTLFIYNKEKNNSNNFLKKILHKCIVCYKNADQRCQRCKAVSYCGRECQIKDWPQHKKNCKLKPEKK